MIPSFIESSLFIKFIEFSLVIQVVDKMEGIQMSQSINAAAALPRSGEISSPSAIAFDLAIEIFFLGICYLSSTYACIALPASLRSNAIQECTLA